MYSKSSRLFTPAFRGGASNSQVLGARPVQQVRRIVNRPLFDALQQSPWAPTLAQHYQFQGPGECVTNAEEMQARILYALHGQGRIEIVGRTDSGSRLLAKLQQRFGINKTPDLDREYRVNPTVDEIVDMVERFPPCVLILARMLPADEGGIQYPGHHAVLAVDTVEVEGQIWVVAVDGCDQKSGPIMARVRAYADKYHDGDLEKITNGDLSAIRMEMKQAGEPGDPGQLVYSVINLDQAVAKADANCRTYLEDLARNGGYSDLPPITFPNSICVATNIQTTNCRPLPEVLKSKLARIVSSLPLDATSSLGVKMLPDEL